MAVAPFDLPQPKNLCTDNMSLRFIEPELLKFEVLYCRNWDFLLFVPATLTLTQLPSYVNLTCISWTSSYVKAVQSYHLTDRHRQTDIIPCAWAKKLHRFCNSLAHTQPSCSFVARHQTSITAPKPVTFLHSRFQYINNRISAVL